VFVAYRSLGVEKQMMSNSSCHLVMAVPFSNYDYPITTPITNYNLLKSRTFDSLIGRDSLAWKFGQ